MAFHPEVLEVRRGDTVVWVNRDIVPHTATATGTGGGTTKWDTGQLGQGQTGRYVVRRAGVSHYACTFHPTMHGKLIVR